jgi:hypothetical protein
MEAAWLALAEKQDWLDGERSPVDPNAGLKAKGKSNAICLAIGGQKAQPLPCSAALEVDREWQHIE